MGWFGNDGFAAVTAFLRSLDISAFDPKAPPPKTPALWAIVDASKAPEDAELMDVLESVHNPEAVTVEAVMSHAPSDFADWLKDRRNRRTIPHRFESVGYVATRNPGTTDGRWKIAGRNAVVYALQKLSPSARLQAARTLAEQSRRASAPVLKVRDLREVRDPLLPSTTTRCPSHQRILARSAREEGNGKTTDFTDWTD